MNNSDLRLFVLETSMRKLLWLKSTNQCPDPNDECNDGEHRMSETPPMSWLTTSVQVKMWSHSLLWRAPLKKWHHEPQVIGYQNYTFPFISFPKKLLTSTSSHVSEKYLDTLSAHLYWVNKKLFSGHYYCGKTFCLFMLYHDKYS